MKFKYYWVERISIRMFHYTIQISIILLSINTLIPIFRPYGRLNNDLHFTQNVYVLIHTSYECYLIWQKIILDVNELRILRWGHYPELYAWVWNIGILIRGKQLSTEIEGDVKTEAERDLKMWLWRLRKWKAKECKQCSSTSQKRQIKEFSPQSFHKETALPLASETALGFLNSTV